MGSKLLVMAAILAGALALNAQTAPDELKPILDQEIQPGPVVAFQLSQYLAARIPKLPSPTSAEQWTSEAKRWREHILNDIAFRGWPREWVDAAPKFEDLGEVEIGQGYRWHKLRYEIVPGFDSTAILYEPEHIPGKAPAILNVNGHDPLGKAAEYKQKRCINFAKRGIVALSLEWMGCGELRLPEDAHDFGAHLDLVGANELGLFYLAMRRGLDYLVSLPQVDRARLGVTGLSGGGWQTIVLGALDERVKVAVEVAGFGSLESNITHPVDTDEMRKIPPTLARGSTTRSSPPCVPRAPPSLSTTRRTIVVSAPIWSNRTSMTISSPSSDCTERAWPSRGTRIVTREPTTTNSITARRPTGSLRPTSICRSLQRRSPAMRKSKATMNWLWVCPKTT